MKHSLVLKFIVILLTAAALVLGICSGLAIVQLVKYNLYTNNIDDFLYKQLDYDAFKLADALAERYAVMELTNCTEEDLKELGYRNYVEGGSLLYGFNEETYSYTITSKGGDVLEAFTKELSEEVLIFETICSNPYPVLVLDEDAVNETYGRDFINTYETEKLTRFSHPVTVREYPSPDLIVTVTMNQDTALIPYGTSLNMVQTLHSLRHLVIFVLAFSVLFFAAGVVYLCAVAGRNSRGLSTHAGALNYLPLDLYALGGTLLSIQLISLAVDMIYTWIQKGKDYNAGTLSLVGLAFLAVALILIGFVYAIATQVKLPKGYWFRHTALYWVGKRLSGLLGLMPVVWKLLISGIFAIALIAGCFVAALFGNYLPLVFCGVVALLILLYLSYAFGCLIRGAEQMSKGNLNEKLNTRYLIGSYKDCADHLNKLADVAIVAARKQMQSDRMKTELITNVSHDIKTPLTSIINYVDILRHTDNKADQEQYLEVLGRQSQRLKKLIEDLMELSKASTGNMQVHPIPLNAQETINQALGEFSDKLEQAGLQVVFQPPEESLTMLADGRMSWRVLSNLFSNAVKYAMPGTRVYLELTRQGGWVLISLKNISREPLNISAEELTERFVRGDASRNTEGSGLGLNIAKSLMELQHGQLRLRIDGDLFKATLMFPLYKETEEA